jgi:hypothetical protein
MPSVRQELSTLVDEHLDALRDMCPAVLELWTTWLHQHGVDDLQLLNGSAAVTTPTTATEPVPPPAPVTEQTPRSAGTNDRDAFSSGTAAQGAAPVSVGTSIAAVEEAIMLANVADADSIVALRQAIVSCDAVTSTPSLRASDVGTIEAASSLLAVMESIDRGSCCCHACQSPHRAADVTQALPRRRSNALAHCVSRRLFAPETGTVC